MSLFRSDEMGFYHLIASREYAWEILNDLGRINSLQFLDLNVHETSFNRPFHNYIKRTDDLEAKINSIENYMKRFGEPITRCEDPTLFLKNLHRVLERRNKVERTYLDDVEGEIEARMRSLTDQVGIYENIVQNYNKLIEYREVLIRSRPYIIHGDFGGDLVQVEGPRRDIKFTYLAGIINREDSLRFRRILFRITRGMTWTALIDVEKNGIVPENQEDPNVFLDPEKVDKRPKTVFLIVYQGGEHGMLKDKLRRICESFGASQYGIPEDPSIFDVKINEVDGQIHDAEGVLKSTRSLIVDILHFFAVPSTDISPYSYIEGLRLFIQKEKTLYHNLNKLRPDHAVFTGHCWCPLDQVPKVEEILKDLSRRKGEMGSYEFQREKIPEGMSPPTNFKLNDVTGVFQEIVNTYGVPRYREINPGLFTIVTFPFLFGVMFGDILHGGLLFIAGLYLLWKKESIEQDKESIWRMALPARYLLALQGFFAFYCGLIYNDFTSMSFNIFGSCYNEASATDPGLQQEDNCTYPLGIDPNWYGTSNELTFLNSFKMKLAIILGVAQMLFGIVLRGVNNSHMKHWLDFCFEFIPMLIFMSLTFGYMVVLIFLKWSLPWGTAGYPIGSAPSIINIFIKMALNPGKWDSKTMGMPLYGDPEGDFQAKLQLVFLLVAVICAVLILVPKPLILISRHKKSAPYAVKDSTLKDSEGQLHKKLLEDHDEEESELLFKATDSPKKQPRVKGEEKTVQAVADQGHAEHFEAGEVFVHQVIETIEFVLGSISNTASYLRLWALSLAHSQLAKVFFDNTLGSAIKSENFFAAWAGYWIFANITFGVLMLMDQMECFLHALRLHWVEFQNKFYKADGYAFEPFSYEKDLKAVKKET